MGRVFPPYRFRHRLIVALLLLQPALAIAQSSTTVASIERLSRMSLQELLNTPIGIASRKETANNKNPAAVFVITRDDIQRSGSSTIPDLLRMVPGLQVAAYNSHTWAISARGNNDVFANKLLVLLDGRTLYHWTFTGVNWYRLDLPLAEIERIEVVRGPGGTLWGANAVNGVINIISRDSRDTHGNHLAVVWDDRGGQLSSFRHSDGDENDSYRLYGQVRKRSNFESGFVDDHWQNMSVGFRRDKHTASRHWTLSGDLQQGQFAAHTWYPLEADEFTYTAASLLSRWQWTSGTGRGQTLQLYIDHFDNHYPATERSTIYDLDWQQLHPVENGELLWGLNLRQQMAYNEDGNGFTFADSSPSSLLSSLFVQHDWYLVPKQWTLISGVKIENHDGDTTEWMPNLRVQWTPTSTTTWWAAVNRAYRMPTVLEEETTIQFDACGTTPCNVPVRLTDNDDLESEQITAYELGLREQLHRDWHLDIALFENHYEDLLLRTPQTATLPYDLQPENRLDETTRGIEVAIDGLPHTTWSLRAAYTYLDSDDISGMGSNPDYYWSLLLGYQLNSTLHGSLWLRQVDKTCSFAAPVFGKTCVDGYTTLDMQVRWRAKSDILVKLIGKDLLESTHREFDSNGGDVLVTEVPRTIYAGIEFGF